MVIGRFKSALFFHSVLSFKCLRRCEKLVSKVIVDQCTLPSSYISSLQVTFHFFKEI